MACTTTCIQPSPSQAHCGACHVTFGGVTGFDRHRRDGQCLTPAEIGYADNGSGVYRAPMSDSGRERLAALEASRVDGDSRLLREPCTDECPCGVVPPTPSRPEGAETISGGVA